MPDHFATVLAEALKSEGYETSGVATITNDMEVEFRLQVLAIKEPGKDPVRLSEIVSFDLNDIAPQS